MRAVRRHALVSLTLLVGCTVLGGPAAAGPEDPSAGGASGRADAALSTVRALLSPDATPPAARPGPRAGDAVDLTLALRDLAVLRADLPTEQQREAAAYLARPTDGGGDHSGIGYTTDEAEPACSALACVHYVTSTDDAVDLTDVSPANGLPDQVDLALATADDVHRSYVGAGYRAPLGDGALGGGAQPDLYLADLGSRGLYGYCTSDQALAPSGPSRAWAYCVLDNDYAVQQYPGTVPTETLQVTTAHEYFHAVQFAYDMTEDAWFLEATATWAEDELYDDVDDNVQFLDTSPLSDPERSMDQHTGESGYGAWIFFRHLAERFRDRAGGMPTLVRDMLRRTDGTYSLRAVARTLEARGTSLGAAFARFAVANTMPGRSYEEAAAQGYPRAQPVQQVRLRRESRSAPPVETRLDHLSSATVRYLPRAGFRGRTWRLRLDVDLPHRRTRAAALVTVMRRGVPDVRRIRVDARGNGTIRVPFSAGRVRHVAVTLVNASDRLRCLRVTRFSCGGLPLDDGLSFRVRARAVR